MHPLGQFGTLSSTQLKVRHSDGHYSASIVPLRKYHCLLVDGVSFRISFPRPTLRCSLNKWSAVPVRTKVSTAKNPTLGTRERHNTPSHPQPHGGQSAASNSSDKRYLYTERTSIGKHKTKIFCDTPPSNTMMATAAVDAADRHFHATYLKCFRQTHSLLSPSD